MRTGNINRPVKHNENRVDFGVSSAPPKGGLNVHSSEGAVDPGIAKRAESGGRLYKEHYRVEFGHECGCEVGVCCGGAVGTLHWSSEAGVLDTKTEDYLAWLKAIIGRSRLYQNEEDAVWRAKCQSIIRCPTAQCGGRYCTAEAERVINCLSRSLSKGAPKSSKSHVWEGEGSVRLDSDGTHFPPGPTKALGKEDYTRTHRTHRLFTTRNLQPSKGGKRRVSYLKTYLPHLLLPPPATPSPPPKEENDCSYLKATHHIHGELIIYSSTTGSGKILRLMSCCGRKEVTYLSLYIFTSSAYQLGHGLMTHCKVLHSDVKMVIFLNSFFAFVLYLRASSASEKNPWNAEIPKSVVGLSGSCVVIPCKFNYPSEGKTYNEFTGIWYKDGSVIYHKETSEIIENFKSRSTLLGDLHHKNCTLKINSLQPSDTGPYFFRIEIKDLDKYSYRENEVAITVKDSPEQPIISVNDQVMSQKETNATCVVSHTCPSDPPPQLTWSHNGMHTSQSQSQDGHWKLTSSLTFTPSREDHNKPLNCSADFSGGKTVTSSKTLKVKYPPYNVNVKSNSPVKENTSVELICSCDSNPPASFQWISLNGSLLANGPNYKLNNVTRYTEAIFCTANNTEGQNSSSPQKINVLYPPEIKNGSSCKSETTVCVCIVDSNPPSEVKWLGPSGVFPSSSVEQNGFLTNFTLQGWEGFPDAIHCSASNSEGNSVITLQVPNHGMNIYIAVATAAVLVTLVVILVCVAKRHCKEEKSNDIYKNNQDDFVDYENWGCDDLACGQDEDQTVYANT
nr:sialic acid-binding Ig-like lectin 5 [Misgurnus anguillicaudatus]